MYRIKYYVLVKHNLKSYYTRNNNFIYKKDFIANNTILNFINDESDVI